MSSAEMSAVEFHEAADELPLLSGERFDELVEDIRANGLIQPIIICDGKILDGRNRYRACREAGVEPRYTEFDGGDPYAYVWSLNGERRDLTADQRYLIWKSLHAKSEDWQRRQQEIQRQANDRRREAAERQKNRGNQYTVKRGGEPTSCGRTSTTGGTTKKANRSTYAGAKAKAAASKTNRGAVERMDRLDRERPDLAERVKNGELPASRALHEMKREEWERRAAEQQAASRHGRVSIHRESFAELAERFDASSIDLLITDPPYITEFGSGDEFDRFASWVKLWARKIKPTGRAYIFTGAYPRELQSYLRHLIGNGDDDPSCVEADGFEVHNVLVWTYRNTIGPTPKNAYKLNWQACFYLAGPEAPPLDCPRMTEQFSVQDVNAPDARFGIRYHAWQKPDELAERLIRHSTNEGDLVVDPFCGTGTFLAAASRLGRDAVGADIDGDMIEFCRRRGLEIDYAA